MFLWNVGTTLPCILHWVFDSTRWSNAAKTCSSKSSFVIKYVIDLFVCTFPNNTDTPQLTQLHTYEILKLNWNSNIFERRAEFFLMRTKVPWEESGGRILLGRNTGGWAVMLRPISSQRVGFRTSAGLLCMYTHNWPTRTQFRIAQNSTSAGSSGT
jgi:hypothetical protein